MKYSDLVNIVNSKRMNIDLEAVKQDGLALRYVKNQTEEICLAAVKKKWLSS